MFVKAHRLFRKEFMPHAPGTIYYKWPLLLDIHAGSRITADVSNRARRVAANGFAQDLKLLANSCPCYLLAIYRSLRVIFDVPACPCNCVIYGPARVTM